MDILVGMCWVEVFVKKIYFQKKHTRSQLIVSVIFAKGVSEILNS